MSEALSSNLDALIDRVLAGERITEAEAVLLFEEGSMADLSRLATAVRDRHNAPDRVSYVVDRNVNYTDVCNVHCSFCAFYRRPEDPRGYVLTQEQLAQKAEATRRAGGTGFLLQGGVNPALSWEDYLELVRFIHHDLGLWVHGFSPVEIQQMARLNGLGLNGTLSALRDAGFGSLPGGGAEILVDRIRMKIAPRKGTVQQWLDVMEAAHEVGLSTTGTMMFGITETIPERIEHLRCLRTQQDRALARKHGGAYTAFAAWPFQSGNTVWEGKVEKPTDVEYLRLMAVARIYLDNIPHMQSSWVTMGRKIGQMALHYGCDDMGSLMFEEHVVSAAGTSHSVDRAGIDHLIRQAGFMPWQRDNVYRPV